MWVLSITRIVILYITCISSTIYSDECVQTGPCSCEFSNGTGIDLSPAVPATFYSTKTFSQEMNGTHIKLSTYYYHPCYDLLLNTPVTAVDNTCKDPLSMCREVDDMVLIANETNKYTMQTERYEYLGTSNKSTFNGTAFVYDNTPSINTVLLECTVADNSLHIHSLSEPGALVLILYSPDACLKQMGTGRSLGSTLLIVFFSMLIFYLVLGICAKKFLMGATGIEVIPNLAFWSELPNLVRDGWLFTTSGFKLPARGAGPTITPDPNSYDSI